MARKKKNNARSKQQREYGIPAVRYHSPFALQSQMPLTGKDNCLTVASWGITSAAHKRVSLSENAFNLAQDPKPLGHGFSREFKLTDYFGIDFLKNWDFFRVLSAEVYATPMVTGSQPIHMAVISSVDYDGAVVPPDLNSVMERPNHTITRLSNDDGVMKMIARFQPRVYQNSSTNAQTAFIKKNDAWFDTGIVSHTTFVGLGAYGVCYNASSYDGTFSPAIITQSRIVVEFRGRLNVAS